MTISRPLSLASDLWRARVNMAADEFRLILLADTYAPNMATHSRRVSFTAHELATGGGYTQGGIVVSISETIDSALQTVDYAFAGGTLGSSANTARYGAWFKWTGTAANDIFLLLLDFGRIQAGPFVVPAQKIRMFQ